MEAKPSNATIDLAKIKLHIQNDDGGGYPDTGSKAQLSYKGQPILYPDHAVIELSGTELGSLENEIEFTIYPVPHEDELFFKINFKYNDNPVNSLVFKWYEHASKDFMTASSRGDVTAFRNFLDQLNPADYPTHQDVFTRFNLVHMAIRLGDMPILQEVIEKGADINAQTAALKETPLHQAIELGKVEMIRLLLAKGARTDIKSISNARTPKEQSSLDLARASQNKEIRELFGFS